MNINDFLLKELEDCRARKIDVLLSPTATIACGNFETTGWFDEESLHVAIDRPLSEWLSTFVHESCHKDQFVEGVPAWDTKIGGHDAVDILDMWLDRLIELSPEQMAPVIAKVQGVELDCEIRSVKKMTDYGLPIDLNVYTQKANAYIWFHQTLPITRRWTVAPYNDPKLLALMPSHFDNDYTVMPDGFLEIIQEILK